MVFKKGMKPWNKGKKHSWNTKEKMRMVRKGKTFEEIFGEERARELKRKIKETTTGEKNPFYGKHHTEETKEILRNQRVGKKLDITHRKNIGKSLMGHKPWGGRKKDIKKFNTYFCEYCNKEFSDYISNKKRHFCSVDCTNKFNKENPKVGEANPFYGKNHTEKSRKKMSSTKQGIPSKEWGEFISYEPYGPKFNNKLKKLIRERDSCCMLCNIGFEDLKLLKRQVNVHHINYNKKCNIAQNLIVLCNPCHGKTHTNRKHWIKFFQSLLSERYNYQYSGDGRIILNLREDIN